MRFSVLLLAGLALAASATYAANIATLPEGVREDVMAELADARRDASIVDLAKIHRGPLDNSVVDEASQIAARSFLSVQSAATQLPEELLNEHGVEEHVSETMTAAELVESKELEGTLGLLEVSTSLNNGSASSNTTAPTLKKPTILHVRSTVAPAPKPEPLVTGVHTSVLQGYKHAVVLDAAGKRVKHKRSEKVVIKTVPAGSLPKKPTNATKVKLVKARSPTSLPRHVRYESGKKVNATQVTFVSPSFYRPGERASKNNTIDFDTKKFVTPGFYPTGWLPPKSKGNPMWYPIPAGYRVKLYTAKQYYAPLYQAVAVRPPPRRTNAVVRIPRSRQLEEIQAPRDFPEPQVHEVDGNLVVTDPIRGNKVTAYVVDGARYNFPTNWVQSQLRPRIGRSYVEPFYGKSRRARNGVVVKMIKRKSRKGSKKGRKGRKGGRRCPKCVKKIDSKAVAKLRSAAITAQKRSILAVDRARKSHQVAEQFIAIARQTKAPRDVKLARLAIERSNGAMKSARVLNKQAVEALEEAEAAATAHKTESTVKRVRHTLKHESLEAQAQARFKQTTEADDNKPAKKGKKGKKGKKKGKKGKKGKKSRKSRKARKARKAAKKNRKLRKAKVRRGVGRGYVRAEIYGRRGGRRVRVVPVYYRVVAVRRAAPRRRLAPLPVSPPLPAATALRHAQEDLAAAVDKTNKNSPAIQDAIDAASLALDAARLAEALKEAAAPANARDAANFQLPGSFTPTPRFQRLKTEITTAAEAKAKAEAEAKLKAEADAAAEVAAKQYLEAEAAARQEQEMVTELDAEMGFQADAKLGAAINADAEIQAEASLDSEAKQTLSEQLDAEKGLDLNNEEALLAEANANEADQETLNSLTSALSAQ